jgi:TolB-like protein/tetratricopeptide (TPR) repeat protein/tRNA A-37 threonylcarbamoyl transferase component Bud32
MGSQSHVLDDALAQGLMDRYDVVREVGRGGMASVYLAADRKHDRRVAIKVLRPDVATSLGAERFLREVRLVARLQHPHILPLYDSGETGGLLYFVMPFVEGESLRDRLRHHGALTLDDCTRILRQIADALDYAHARGVVHRDLKPENVLLVEGQALLADFGVARAAAGRALDRGDTLTSAGVTLGTPTYMSPEQAAADQNIDSRSDIYSLGCVCYEMLAGVPPFRGPNAMAVIGQHIVTPPPTLAGVREHLSDAVSNAVTRALAKDPADRFPTAGEFATALERALIEARAPSPADLRLRALERQQEARQSVLVLEFANIAGAADAEWLCTGIAETVGADLNKVAGIKLVGQDAATRRRIEASRQQHAVDADRAIELGRSVGARWVVWGSFQKFGHRIRITPHFANTREGTVINADKIDGVMDDIFQLQDSIVTGLADVLRIRLTSAEVAQIEQPQTTHLSAYEHYARGYRDYLQFGKESTKLAADHFRAAIAIDPNYALAHAGLGVLHGPLYIATGRREVLEEGTRLLERALALDPSLGEAYAWLAYMHLRQHRFDDTERVGRRGIEHDPSSFMCWYMLGIGRLARAVVTHEHEELARAVGPQLRAIAINPSYHPSHMALGSIYTLCGTYGHAAPLLDRAVELELSGAGLQFLGSLVQRALVHLGSGELTEAAPLLDRAIERYAGADHVYAETMTVFARCARGYLTERTGELESASRDFTRACEIADANEHRISIGGHWVRARFGRARVLYRLGRVREGAQSLAEAEELFTSRSRFVWTWFYGATDAEILYDLASTFATMDRSDAALDALRRAADAGWADVTWLRHDPAFVALRDTEEVQRLCTDAASRAMLPPPVGSGGLG